MKSNIILPYGYKQKFLKTALIILAFYCSIEALATGPDVYLGNPVAEVIVRSSDQAKGQIRVGNGWAMNVRYLNENQCIVLTAFHIVGDRIDKVLSNEIQASGPGSTLGVSLEPLDDSLQFPDKDLAVLRLQSSEKCPFTNAEGGDHSFSEGFYLRKLGNVYGGELQRRGNEVRGIVPVDASGIVAKGYIEQNSDSSSVDVRQVEVVRGWSGSSVIKDRKRIGMATATEDGNQFHFLTLRGIQDLFGRRLDILTPTSATAIDNARSELQTLGVEFNRADLSIVLSSAETAKLQLIDKANLDISLLEDALIYIGPNTRQPAVFRFFRKTIEKPDAIVWFKNQLDRGLNPMLLVTRVNGRDEALLSVAIKAGNPAAAKALLDAGANPTPLGSLDGVRSITSMMVSLFSNIRYLQGASAERKKALAKLLLSAGAVVPHNLHVFMNGEKYTKSHWEDRNMIAPEFEAEFRRLGLNATPTPDLCQDPKPLMCHKETKRTGFDWCTFLAEVPKGFTYEGRNESKLRAVFMSYFLGTDDNSAYFLSRSPSRAVVAVSGDYSTIRVTSEGDSYSCGTSSTDYCLLKGTATRIGKSKYYDPDYSSARWKLVDICESIEVNKTIDQSRRTNVDWYYKLKEEATPFRGLGASSYATKNAASSAHMIDRMVRAAKALDLKAFQRTKVAIERYPDVRQLLVSFSEPTTPKMKRNIALSFVSKWPDWRRLLPGNETDIRAITLLDWNTLAEAADGSLSENDLDRMYEKAIRELGKTLSTGRTYIVSDVYRATYDEELKKVRFALQKDDATKDIPLGHIEPLIQRKHLEYVDTQSSNQYSLAFPASYRSRIVLDRDSGRGRLEDSSLRDPPRNSYGSGQLLNADSSFYAISLNSRLIIPPIDLSKSDFDEVQEVANRRLSTYKGDGWKIVTVLNDLTVTDIPSRHSMKKVLNGSIEKVLIVGPDMSLVHTIEGGSLRSQPIHRF